MLYDQVSPGDTIGSQGVLIVSDRKFTSQFSNYTVCKEMSDFCSKGHKKDITEVRHWKKTRLCLSVKHVTYEGIGLII